jgi:hypothetical protein
MTSKLLSTKGNRNPLSATNLSPADFPLGSPQSRAAVRAIILEAKEHNAKWDRMGEREASFDAGCLLWLTRFTETEDNHWMAKGTPPVAPFPAKQYFAVVLRYILDSPRIFIPKSREMMTSWLVCGYIAWMCQWFPQILWILQTDKEDKVVELVDYCRILYQRQEPWMQERVKITGDNTTELRLSNGSHIVGVPKGSNQVRLYHPYGYMMDEAAFLPEAQQCYDSVHPVAKQIIAVSSANPGWFANECGADIIKVS